MVLKIPILLIILVVYAANPLPIDSNPTLSSINPVLNPQDAENTENLNTKNEEESKTNENTVNLNMNRGNKKPSELETIIEQQKNIHELLLNAYQSSTPKTINFFNPQDIIKYREQGLLNHQQQPKLESQSLLHSQSQPQTQNQPILPLSHDRKQEKTQNLQSKDLTPMEKIFNSISRSNFRIRGLIIINNNNNNNNVDEDKFTIDEIIKLLEKKEYIGYQDIIEYDQKRKLHYLKAKDEGIRPLKAESTTGDLSETVNEGEKIAGSENLDNITNINHENNSYSSINMLKGKNENVKPLQFEFVKTNTGGLVIVNNVNNNNNEKIKKAYKHREPVNIKNVNDGVQLPMNKLSDKDIKKIVETSIIVNNENNNNNIT
jgi:hypothetical protein